MNRDYITWLTATSEELRPNLTPLHISLMEQIRMLHNEAVSGRFRNAYDDIVAVRNPEMCRLVFMAMAENWLSYIAHEDGRTDEVGTWVFDDPGAGLTREPFVSGVPEMIDYLVKDIANARSGFRLLFSAAPFPGYQKRLVWMREEMGGNWYASNNLPMEGWLCPALFRYFDGAPVQLYVKAEAKGQ